MTTIVIGKKLFKIDEGEGADYLCESVKIMILYFKGFTTFILHTKLLQFGGKMSRFIKLVLVFIFPAILIGITSATMKADPDTNPNPVRRSISTHVEQFAKPFVVDGSSIIQDGGFENGTPNAAWQEYSSNFGTPICTIVACAADPAHKPNSGTYWAWFGGAFDERTTLTQTITMPVNGTAEMEFYFHYVGQEAGAAGNDYFRIFVDGNQLFEVTDTISDFTTYGGSNYHKVTINLDSYADGQQHSLVFEANVGPESNGEGVDSFFVDDVSIRVGAMVYLPITFKNYCSPPSYSELVRYNMSIINAPAMWAFEGRCALGEGITVAVIDTGVDLDHPDLQENIVNGRTYVAGTSTPDDDEGHGTHVAGAVAAAMNGTGVLGVAPRANIMPIKALDFEGSGSTSNVAAAVRWAVDNGAHIINLSLGSVNESPTMKDAVNYATNNGALVIAAAGNCGSSSFPANGCTIQDEPSFPAAFENVMAVASTTSSDTQSSFSTEGSYVEIAAPGSSIYSTVPGGSYASTSGTSQATPHVAGLAAAVWSLNPSLTNSQVRALINNTAVDLGSAGRDIQFGYGRIDAYAAATQGLNAAKIADPSIPAYSENEPLMVDLTAPHVPGEILVKMVNTSRVQLTDNVETLFASVFATDEVTITQNEELEIYLVEVPVGEELAYLDSLNAMTEVEYAELNYIVSIR